MSTSLRVLILEDQPSDAESIVHELRRAGFEPDWRRVATEEEYLAHLDPALDIILADDTLPQFNAPQALHALQRRELDIPFIVLTGTSGEEAAVECIGQGAADYLLKDRLVRLGQAVTRALEERRLRADRARLFQEERTRRRQLEAVRAVTVEITREVDLPTLLGLITRRATEMLGGHAGVVFLWEDAAQVLVPQAWHGRGEWTRDLRIRMGEGITGAVAQRRAGLIVNDYRAWPHALPLVLEHTEALAIMAEPILYRDRLLGVIHVERHTTTRQFTREDQEFLALFAAQAAIAIANARAYAEVERRRRIAKALNRVGAMMTAALDLETVTAAIGRAVVELLDAPLVRVMVLDPARGQLVTAASVGEPELAQYDPRARSGRMPLAEAAFERGEPAYACPIARDPRYVNQEWAARHGLQMYLVIPLRAGGEKIGNLNLHRREARRLTGEETTVLISFAEQAAIVIQSARLLEEVRGARDFLQSIMANSTDAIATLDLEGRLTYISPGAQELLGYRADEVLGRHFGEFFEGGKEAAHVVLQRLPSALRVRDHEARAWTKEGRWVDLSISLAALRDADGAIVGTLAIARDITTRKQAEEALRNLSRAVEQSPASIVITDAAGTIEYVNPKFTEVTGYTLEEVRGQNPRIVKSGETPPEVYAHLWATITAGREWRGEFRNRRKDGTLVLEAASISPVRDTGGVITHFIAVKEDITERRRVEEQLRQTEKIATMGQLLAGVAHELNNPLSVVMGQAMLLQMKLGDDPLGGRTRKIQDAAERCARIVRNFLALARQHPPERQQVYLNKAVEETVELMAYPLRVDTVKVTLDLAPDLPAISGDPHQLQQVLVNLITNAHHAMQATPPPRGLTLTTRFDSARGCVTLEVADTGPGIPAEIRDRIFDPFFTTKPAEEGTGLGLSLCQGIVEGHGGSIGVACPPGQGAVFRVELPVGPAPAPVPGATVPEEVAPLREKRILIVDDEAMIRDLLGDVLSADAHQVDEAASGVGALEKLQAGAYDMILSDIKMPELDGPGLYREVERRQPEMARRFAVLTGDALSPETWAFLEAVPVPRLVKPFTLAEVRRVVRQVLGDKAPDGPGRAGDGKQG